MNKSFKLTTHIFAIFFLLIFAGCSDEHAEKGAENQIVDIGEITKVPEFAAIKDTKMKKKAFFDFMRPIIQSENKKVAKSRERLLNISVLIDNGEILSKSDREWIAMIADKYRINMPTIDDEEAWKLLKLRVDTVPFRLALAQSANESSWGTSRFVKQGLNFFGEWCFTKNCGIVPLKRTKGLTHEVSSFKSVNESVASYIRNLNRVEMYKPLRVLRLEMRNNKKPLTAHKLAAGLVGYSERKHAYVDEIRVMIKHNYDLMEPL